MFNGCTDDIAHDMSVLVIDKYLYDNGFPITDSDISYDSEYETFYDALIQMDGEFDDDEGDETDSTVVVYRNDCLKSYIREALKYGGKNGIPKDKNYWLYRLESRINSKMQSIGDYSYDYDYNVTSVKKAFFKVYIGPEFYQTVSMVQAVAEILHFIEETLSELEGLNGNREAKIIPMKNINDRRKAA